MPRLQLSDMHVCGEDALQAPGAHCERSMLPTVEDTVVLVDIREGEGEVGVG